VPVIAIPIERITDWDSFHDVFAEALGFPDFYGRSLDAWIDCLTYADDPDAGMIDPALIADNGDVLTLQLGRLGDFAERCSAQYDALLDCSSFVNWRRIESGARPILALSFHRE
jgi:hypothetical protein